MGKLEGIEKKYLKEIKIEFHGKKIYSEEFCNDIQYLISLLHRLLEAIEKLKPLTIKFHYYCEDCWYSCPLAEDGCCDDLVNKDKCNCGADEHNKKVEEIYKSLEDL
jgi:hypothetical protein